MNGWAKGFIIGVLAAGAVLVLAVGRTTFEGFVRVDTGGGLVLDLRQDESLIGQAVNAPLGSLGEARVTKRTWLILSTYALTLVLRPEVAPGPGRAVGGMRVQASLPGRPVTTNATRLTDRGAVWDSLPAGSLHLTTRAVHWGRIVIVLLGVAAVGIVGRRR